jgi:hypothetical protein
LPQAKRRREWLESGRPSGDLSELLDVTLPMVDRLLPWPTLALAIIWSAITFRRSTVDLEHLWDSWDEGIC